MEQGNYDDKVGTQPCQTQDFQVHHVISNYEPSREDYVMFTAEKRTIRALHFSCPKDNYVGR
ncbi:hypothetical protein CHS0354_010866 [Potamilus streckersoni]|uniref:Uncharacterized protein n=1 Tax=Potamilus streckersoni TaxID=2493646 RepID=A0AAE0VYE2_9BIVA|nr:hypothetical protein CHS0354_010866 [Potamilus streckersoni]